MATEQALSEKALALGGAMAPAPMTAKRQTPTIRTRPPVGVADLAAVVADVDEDVAAAGTTAVVEGVAVAEAAVVVEAAVVGEVVTATSRVNLGTSDLSNP